MASLEEDIAPIHRLPPEIMVCIFLMYTPAPRPHSGFGHRHRPHPLHASRWTSLMLVCRHWRDIALASPTLWQAVDVRKSAAWLELAVERSRGAVLDLCFHERQIALESIPLIAAEAQRIRTLLLPFLKRVDLPVVQTLLQTAMPALRELRVHLEPSWMDTTAAAKPVRISSDFGACFPLLSSARFECMAVPLPRLCLSRMRSLTLRDCTALDKKFTFGQFLDVLEGCTELEDLRLHRFVSTLSERVPDDGARTVVLPRLKRLTVRDAPAFCRQLLSAVQLPPTIVLRVFGLIGPHLDPREARTLFPSMLPADESRLLPVLRTATHGIFHGSEAMTFYLWSDRAPFYTPSPGSVMLTLDWPRSDMGGYTLRALEDFKVLFAKAPLEVVEIGCMPRSVPSSVIWTAIFATFRAVHTLTVLPGQTVRPVWYALAGEQLPLLEVSEDAARAFCPELLPRLRTLRMEYLEWGEEAMGYILESLRRRAMRGLPKLENLTILFFQGGRESKERVKEEIRRALPFYEENVAAFANEFEWGWI
ncbi:hypothetical protein C8Q80DRAFT_441658 [Daedaleopsis nitida]|nr:hypothetical protein C8Q80DRAFT_441658 [Daedaleopsis nitida]